MNTALSAPPQHIIVPSPDQPTNADWKQQLTERLDSYRAKHAGSSPPRRLDSHKSTNARASKIAQAIASRYESVPSYGELLLAAEQAERGRATARSVEQPSLEFDQPSPIQQTATAKISDLPLNGGLFSEEHADEDAVTTRTVMGTPVMPHFTSRSREMHLHQAPLEPEPSLEDLLAQSLVEPRTVLPSKLIEFPREFVSAHRARPRLAETVIQEEIPPLPEVQPPPLRIFEVEPEAEAAITARTDSSAAAAVEPTVLAQPGANANMQPEASASDALPSPSRQPIVRKPAIAPPVNNSTSAASSTTKAPAEPVSGKISLRERAPRGLEWASISLDREPASHRRKNETSVAAYVPFMVDPASIDRRIMAFAVDFAAVTGGFLGFLAVFAACTPHLPTGLTAVALGVAVYAALWVLYQMLFFSLSGATTGMLYARIALCTFDDQNPTRDALRRRLGAWWLSCLPIGLGFLWSFVDEDNLCWHDRITRMYQRTY